MLAPFAPAVSAARSAPARIRTCDLRFRRPLGQIRGGPVESGLVGLRARSECFKSTGLWGRGVASVATCVAPPPFCEGNAATLQRLPTDPRARHTPTAGATNLLPSLGVARRLLVSRQPTDPDGRCLSRSATAHRG